MPSVVCPGSYGTTGQPVRAPSGGSPSKEVDEARKRMMYPAGRIMHLVPAYLVEPHMSTPAEEESAGIEAMQVDAKKRRIGSRTSGDVPSSAGADRQGGASTSAATGATATSPRAGLPGWESVFDVDMEDMIAAEDGFSPRSYERPSAGFSAAALPAEGSLDPMKTNQSLLEAAANAIIGAETDEQASLREAGGASGREPWVLLDHVPQEAYARIRLCRTMLKVGGLNLSRPFVSARGVVARTGPQGGAWCCNQ